MNGAPACNEPSFAIGIDLGLATCRVAVKDNANLRCIWSQPAVISILPDGWKIGEAAKTSPRCRNAVYDFLRLLGRKASDPSVTTFKETWSFLVVAGKHDKLMVELCCDGKRALISPEEIIGAYLRELKEQIEKILGQPITKATFATPASLNHTQQRAFRDAAAIANLSVEHLVASSTLAAIYYAEYMNYSVNSILAVDIGAGSCDVSFLHVHHQPSTWTVNAIDSNCSLGGTDLTRRLALALQQRTSSKWSLSTSSVRDGSTDAAELAKRILSWSPMAAVEIESSAHECGVAMSVVVSRTEFEDLCREETQQVLSLLQHTTPDGIQRTCTPIDKVVLTGGSNRIACLQSTVSSFVPGGADLVQVCVTDKDLNMVALGAAHAGWTVRSNPSALHQSLPLSIGVETHSGKVIELARQHAVLPVPVSRCYYSSRETEVILDVVEGPKPLASGQTRHCLGRVVFDGQRTSSNLVLKIDLILDVDADGKIMLTVRDFNSDRCLEVPVDGDETSLSEMERNSSRQRLERGVFVTETVDLDPTIKQKADIQQHLKNLETVLESGHWSLPLSTSSRALLQEHQRTLAASNESLSLHFNPQGSSIADTLRNTHNQHLQFQQLEQLALWQDALTEFQPPR